MGKIVISTNISLDGVFQDPTGEEGFDRGGWFLRIAGADREQWNRIGLEEARGAAAVLLGGRSYEWFAQRWAAREGEWADRLRALPKYVVSGTPRDPAAWANTTILKGDAVTEVSKLRANLNGDILVYASAHLGRTLLEHDLADEFRLTTFPFVLGAGERLFGGTGTTKPVHLAEVRPIGESLTYVVYRTAPVAR